MAHKIVIVDDHILIAEALSGIIKQFNHYEVLYETDNGNKMMEKFKQPKNIPDIVLLDIMMPIMDGFETARWLSKNHPDILILALSMHDEEEMLIKMIRSGAKGYLLKNVHASELERALDSLMEKGFYYPDWIANKVIRNLSRDVDGHSSSKVQLNDRELAFLQYASSELTYKEIGEKMFCSPRTVESYRDSLFEKLGYKTRIGLVLYGLKNGLIKL